MSELDLSGIGPETYAVGGGGGDSAPFPFQILLRQNEDDSWSRIVLPGFLFLSTDRNERHTITGLAASDAPEENDPGWANTADTDEIWLEGTVGAELALGTVAVRSLTVDGPIESAGIEHDGDDEEPAQTKFRVFIGKVGTEGDALVVQEQFVRAHLLLEYGILEGTDAEGAEEASVAAIYPYSK